MLYHRVTVGEPVFLTTYTSVWFHMGCTWGFGQTHTFISCFLPLLPPPPFTPSETAAFRLIVKFGFHSFLFWALFMGVERGVAAELNLGNREEKCEPVGRVPHVMCSALLSRLLCWGQHGEVRRQLKWGSSAPAPKLHDCNDRRDRGSSLWYSWDCCSSSISLHSWSQNLIISGFGG